MIDALAPVCLLVGLGYVLRATGFMPDAAWGPVDRLVYFVLFPCLLFRELAGAELGPVPVARLGGCLVLTQLGMVAAALALRSSFRLGGPAHTSVLQCVVRWNSYVALALAPVLVPGQGPAMIALAVAVMVPTANLLSVAALARHGAGGAGTAGPATFARAVATNPLILATAAGAIVNASGLALPHLLLEPVTIAGRAALALGLLTVGAGLRPKVMAGRPVLVLAATAAQLLLKPLVALAVGMVLGLHGPALAIAILACAVPTATSSYILARLLGGDAELMAALVTTTTVGAVLTLPLVFRLVAGTP
jgi:hypothetical protein